MKKIIVLILICVTGVIACGKKIVPESGENNIERKSTKESREDRNYSNSSRNTTPSFNNMERTAPQGQENNRVFMDIGKTIYVNKCGGCHALKNPSDYTLDQMSNFLNAEIAKAKLDKKDAEHVRGYMMANAKK